MTEDAPLNVWVSTQDSSPAHLQHLLAMMKAMAPMKDKHLFTPQKMNLAVFSRKLLFLADQCTYSLSSTSAAAKKILDETETLAQPKKASKKPAKKKEAVAKEPADKKPADNDELA
jgi:dihydroxyacetone kinase